MNNSVKFNKFVDAANKKFISKFDYSRVVYKNANTKVNIICPIHGKFITTPWNHLYSKHGCSKCGTDAMAEQQRNKSVAKLNEYIQSGLTDYDYSLTTLNKITDKITVICKLHGAFNLTADHHIRGVGCKKCADQNKLGGYTEEWFNFDNSRKNIPGLLYLLEMYSDTERFIKIGITKKSIKERYRGCKYNYNIIKKHYSSLYDCYLKEKFLKEYFFQHRYLNSLQLYKTESFCLPIKDQILKFFPDEVVL